MFRLINRLNFSLPFMIAIAAFAVTHQTSHADVSVANGDFELPGTNIISTTFPAGVPLWGEVNYSTFADFLIVGAPHGAYLNGQTGGLNPAGMFYQEIGTSSGKPTIRVTGLNFARNDESNQHADLNVQLWWLPNGHAFTFAEVGNDIATVGNLINSFTVADPVVQNTITPFSLDFDVSSNAADDRLFLRFTAGTGNFAYVDNVAAAAVPEPMSLLILLGFGCAAIGRRRRR